MSRQIRNKKLRIKCAVVGDGRTEQYYLGHLKKIRGYAYSVKPRFFDSISLFDAEGIIDDLLDGGCDRVIFFTDYDTVIRDEKVREFKRFTKKYGKNDKVIICESMPSIEFWFLLHFQHTTKRFCNAKEVENELKKHIPGYSKLQRNFLRNKKWVENLISDNKMDVAIEVAKKIMEQKNKEDVGTHFPYTKVNKAINEFEKRKEE